MITAHELVFFVVTVFFCWVFIYNLFLIQGSDSEEMMINEASNQLKTCVDCGTSKTPLWRGGPAGPKVCVCS